MNRCETIDALRGHVKTVRAEGKKVGFIPTMGALHPGHASLITKAREMCEEVVVSIFVNPTQFNSREDFEAYPLTLNEDMSVAQKSGAALVFTPSLDELYAGDFALETLDYGLLTSRYEGQSRLGHFDGVVAVVRKLFSAVDPDMAFFGEKDLQQLAIIRRLAREEFNGLEVIACPLVREDDGLAMSSRSVRLSGRYRQDALALFHWVSRVKKAAETKADISGLLQTISGEAELMKHIELEYIDVVNAETFEPLRSRFERYNAFVIVAARVGGVRLIDNCRLACS